MHDYKKSPTDECIGSARARYVEPLSPSLGQFGSWSSVRCSRSLVRSLVAAAQLVEMYEV